MIFFTLKGYLSMRALGGRNSLTITATTRQLESLIRLSQVRHAIILIVMIMIICIIIVAIIVITDQLVGRISYFPTYPFISLPSLTVHRIPPLFLIFLLLTSSPFFTILLPASFLTLTNTPSFSYLPSSSFTLTHLFSLPSNLLLFCVFPFSYYLFFLSPLFSHLTSFSFIPFLFLLPSFLF